MRARSVRLAVAIATLTAAAVSAPANCAIASDMTAYLNSARQLEKANNLRGALIQLRNAAQSDQRNGVIHLDLARIYLKLGNPNAAEAEVFAAHTRGLKDEATAPYMAQALFQMGEFGDLLKQLQAGHRPARVESIVRSYRGMAELALKSPGAASALFRDAQRLDPRSTLPLIGEARLLLSQHQNAAAQKKAEEALTLNPKDSDAVEVRALSLAAQGNSKAALQQLDAAIILDHSNIRAVLDRANLEARLNKMDLAQRDVQAVQKLAPGNAAAMFLQATIDVQRGKLKEADAILDRLRGAMTAFPTGYLVAAGVKLRLNQTAQAQDFLNKFIAQTGGDPKAYQMLGMIALKRGDVNGAIELLEKAVRLAPNDAELTGMLGQAYMAHGDFDKAKQTLDQAAAKMPGNAALATQHALTEIADGDVDAGVAELSKAFNGGKGSIAAGPPLVFEALQSGRFDEADAAVHQLLVRDPGNTMYRELQAAVRIAKHDFAGAETLLKVLLAKDPNLSSARRDLSMIYLQTHRPDEARKLYEDRLNSNPSDTDSMEALANIAFQQKNDSAAMQWLSKAQAKTSANPRPTLKMLGLLEARKKWPEAIGRARALQMRFPKDPSVADALGHLYFSAGQLRASLGVYRDAMLKFPNFAPLYAHYAAVCSANKDYSGAAAAVLRASRLDPKEIGLKRSFVALTYLAKGGDAALSASRATFSDPVRATLVTVDVLESNHNEAAAKGLLEKSVAQTKDSRILLRLASLYEKDGRQQQALALVEPWTKKHPDDYRARFMLALLYSGANRLDEAREEYEWLSAQRANNAVVLNNLAWLYWLKHDPRAHSTAVKAVYAAPGSGSAADTLGWILVNEGDAANALKYFERARAAIPTDQTIQYHYAVALTKLGKIEEAKKVLSHVVQSGATSLDTAASAKALLEKTNKSSM